MTNSDDQVIALGLVTIRKGIAENDMAKVCEGYNAISGENLSPKTSRLDNIRSLMAEASEEKDDGSYKESSSDEIEEEHNIRKIEGKDFKTKADVTIEHIEVPFDEEEAELNRKIAAKKSKTPRPQAKKITDNSKTDSEVRVYFDRNTPPNGRPSRD